MDKKVIFAVAGSGKTTLIVDNLSNKKRSLIITYTDANYKNLQEKIITKFHGEWPENIVLMKFFPFLYRFCYKPFLADRCKAKGITFDKNENQFSNQKQWQYYLSQNRYFYSNRLSLFLEKAGVMDDIRKRTSKYFDEFIIDEVQDIAGRDFTFLEHLMLTEVNMLFVGDFFQHTYDTSRDGNANSSLFESKSAYEARFIKNGFVSDNTTLINSWRCSQNVCNYVRDNLGISIFSNRAQDDNTNIEYISDPYQISKILSDNRIVKLHYNNSAKYGYCHRNWGETKGEDKYQDVCIILNKSTAKMRSSNKLCDLPPPTKNKLYVAITRANGNVYLVDDTAISF